MLVVWYSISASGDRTLRIWSAETGEELTRISAHERGIASLDVDFETGTAVTGSSDWGIRLHQLSEWGFDFGKAARVDGADGVVNQSDAQHRPHRAADPEHPNGLEFIAGRNCCSEGTPHGHSDVNQGETRSTSQGARCYVCHYRGHKDLVRSLWLGKDIVISGSYDSTMKIWDRHTGVLLCDLPGLHTGRVFSVVGDPTKVVSSGIDQVSLCWLHV